MEKVMEVIEKYGGKKQNLIQIMLELQNLSGRNYLPAEWVAQVSQALDIPISRVYGVITFYAMFHTGPRGRFLVEVCKSGPCHVSGSENVLLMLEKELGIKPGETTQDECFSLGLSSCFGACDIAPAIKIGEKVYGSLTQESLKELLESYRGRH